MSSVMRPRLPVTSAAATAPACPPIASAIRRVSVLRPVDRRDYRQIERRRASRRAHLDRAGERADGADAVEVGVAREVVAARPRRLRQRQQARPAGDEISGSDALQVAQGRAHPGRPALGRKARELARPDDDAASPDTLLDDLDEAWKSARR